MTRIPLIAGNWKMHNTLDQARTLAQSIVEQAHSSESCEILLCPTFTALSTVSECTRGKVALGAQNMYTEPKGAFTGEVSPTQLCDLGVSYVILGHSERRTLFKETDAFINHKVHSALKHRLRPVVCVGETLQERETNSTEKVLKSQVQAAFKDIPKDAAPQVVIAYEPVWAIGTGKTATPEMAQQAHAFIRSILAGMWGEDAAAHVRILYGGSMKPDNAQSLLGQKDIDGGLIGGAALEASSFLKIIQSAQPVGAQ